MICSPFKNVELNERPFPFPPFSSLVKPNNKYIKQNIQLLIWLKREKSITFAYVDTHAGYYNFHEQLVRHQNFHFRHFIYYIIIFYSAFSDDPEHYILILAYSFIFYSYVLFFWNYYYGTTILYNGYWVIGYIYRLINGKDTFDKSSFPARFI